MSRNQTHSVSIVGITEHRFSRNGWITAKDCGADHKLHLAPAIVRC